MNEWVARVLHTMLISISEGIRCVLLQAKNHPTTHSLKQERLRLLSLLTCLLLALFNFTRCCGAHCSFRASTRSDDVQLNSVSSKS